MLIEGTTVRLPGPTADSAELVLNLEKVFLAEVRQGEVATVTPFKAPELLAFFNKIWLDLDEMIKDLVAAETKAEQEVGRVRARLLLNEVEAIIKEKKVASTKESRDAVIVLDQRYIDAQDRVDAIHATAEWLKGKMKSFENSYTSVKKIMGDDAYNMSSRRPAGSNPLSVGATKPFDQALAEANKALEKVGTGWAEQVRTTQIPHKTPTGYGKSRYDR